MERLGKYKKLAAVLGILLLVIAPFVITNSYYLHVMILVGVYIILSLSLNLITGYTGQLCLGHAAFYGIGSYVGALLMLNFHVNFFIALIASALVSGLFGLLLGIPTLRLRRVFFFRFYRVRRVPSL